MEPLRIHFLQHVPFEGLGYIETWANREGYTLTSTKFYEKTLLPSASGFDWLIVMGGPMGVYDEEIYPWLKAEKQFIKSAIESRKTVIGICLGSQLIAEALGAKVYPNTQKEIGWFPVLLTSQAKETHLLNGFPNEIMGMHWHGDTFDLPSGAIRLMETKITKNQAFLFNTNILGLQFHLEFTPGSLSNIVSNCRHELIADDSIQGENKILENSSLCEESNSYLSQILDYMTVLNRN